MLRAKSFQSCPTLCDPIDCSPLGSYVYCMLRFGYWSGLPCPPPGDLPDLGIKPLSLVSPALAGRISTTSATCGKPNILNSYTVKRWYLNYKDYIINLVVEVFSKI